MATLSVFDMHSIKRALDEEFVRDRRVLVLGEVAGHYEACYKVSTERTACANNWIMTNIAFVVIFIAALTLYVLWWSSIQHTAATVPETATHCSNSDGGGDVFANRQCACDVHGPSLALLRRRYLLQLLDLPDHQGKHRNEPQDYINHLAAQQRTLSAEAFQLLVSGHESNWRSVTNLLVAGTDSALRRGLPDLQLHHHVAVRALLAWAAAGARHERDVLVPVMNSPFTVIFVKAYRRDVCRANCGGLVKTAGPMSPCRL
ncbi:hypothetical protein AAVH_08741 [Aphelenchoides avenae]|nr:hypothetical protein AAVH_08741 [Aphelenchus avenae]